VLACVDAGRVLGLGPVVTLRAHRQASLRTRWHELCEVIAGAPPRAFWLAEGVVGAARARQRVGREMPERSGVSRGIGVGRKDRPTRRPSRGQRSERGVYRVSYRVIPEEAESDTRYVSLTGAWSQIPSARWMMRSPGRRSRGKIWGLCPQAPGAGVNPSTPRGAASHPGPLRPSSTPASDLCGVGSDEKLMPRGPRSGCAGPEGSSVVAQAADHEARAAVAATD
jgi:hypothetical protein